MKTGDEPNLEQQSSQSTNQPRRKRYEAPLLTILDSDQTKVRLATGAAAGDRDAAEMLRLVS
jgi:hypothetical protein